ncbi:MAG: hypothetical protein KDJ35_07830 [Alphaproteobacteria bacterium]|nr:hypothetical protein [Alphaproteobacteria bacterium]
MTDRKHNRIFPIITAALVIALYVPMSAGAQDQTAPQDEAPVSTEQTQPRIFETNMRAASASLLMAGKLSVHLWGVEDIPMSVPVMALRARTTMANAIGDGKVTCEIKNRSAEGIFAQCENAEDVDLGLLMIQQGYVTVNRANVYGTVFEDVYVRAETEAQARNLGVWGQGAGVEAAQGGDSKFLVMLSLIVSLGIAAAFLVLTVIVMRGFKKVTEAQQNNMDMIKKEQKLREKERGIIATMLDAELKANKSKLEAYLVVYEEMLAGLKNPDKAPKYKQSGDIVQTKPILSRAVFDRNNDKLDMLGHDLAGALVQFYSYIKTNAEYEDLEPDMALETAIGIVEQAVNEARHMNAQAQELMSALEESGVMRERMRSPEV